MRKFTAAITFSMFPCSVIPAQAPATPSNSRMEMKIVGRKGPPIPQAEAGDSIQTDPVTGDLIAESRGMKIRLPKRSAEIQGALDVTVTEAGTGMFRYDYRLSNGPGAKRQVSGVILDVPSPARSTKTVEKGWAAIDKPADPYLPANILIANTAPDTQPNLKSGQRTAFTFLSPDLPGLIEAHILPRYSEGPLSARAMELTDGQFTNGASEWMRTQLRELDTRDRHRLTIHTVAPKLMAGDDNLMKVQNELRIAADSPAFRTMRSKLVEIVGINDAKQLLAALPNGNPFQKVFLDAMAMRLKRLP